MVKKIVLVKAVVFDGQDRILLVRRSKTAPRRALQWDLPGGFVDEGDESYQHACLRELREEAGVEVISDTVSLGYAESVLKSDDAQAYDGSWLYFTAQAKRVDVRLSYEHDKFAWVSLERALELVEYDKQLRALTYIQQARSVG